MTVLQTATYAFAVIGVASFLYFVYRLLVGKAGEDGPIRVKGGSIVIENDDHDWEKDDHDGKHEYHYKGRPNRWKVKVWKNGAICIDWVEARRVKLEVGRDGSGNDGDVVFRPNGSVRVMDEKNTFIATGKKLTDTSTGARIKKVVIRKLDGVKVDCKFDESDKCEVELWLLT